MVFVMFAFNALHASLSLLWHLTAVGRGGGCEEGGSTLQGGDHERAWGCDNKMQMIRAGLW